MSNGFLAPPLFRVASTAVIVCWCELVVEGHGLTVEAVVHELSDDLIGKGSSRSKVRHLNATACETARSSGRYGLLSGKIGPDRTFEGDDLRKDNPRFSKLNREHVAAFADAVAPLAEEIGASVAQVVIAWTIAQPGISYALCGARDAAQALENARAGAIVLGADKLARIDAALIRHLSAVSG